MASFSTQTIDGFEDGSYYIQVIGKAIYINAITITGEAAAATTPIISVSTKTLDFGTLKANSDVQTITVANTGIGSMDVSISNDNTTDFTVSATSLSGIENGTPATFTVAFNYDAASLGDKTATITVTPTYDASAAVAITVSARAISSDVWLSFASGIPDSWYNENGYWSTSVAGLEGHASPGQYATGYALRSPRLTAAAGEDISFDVFLKDGSSYVTAQYSTDRTTWTQIAKYTEEGTKTFAAPAAGDYWLRFYSSTGAIDYFAGWSLAAPTHDVQMGSATIPGSGIAHGTYTAKVELIEMGGTTESLTAALYFGETKMAEKAVTLTANTESTVSISVTPTETFEGNAYIKVTGDNIADMTTDETAVSITETPYVLDDNDDAPEQISASSAVVKLKYSVKKGWNTIVLPFGWYSYASQIFGSDFKAYQVSKFEDNTITFAKKTYFYVGQPYLVYAPNADEGNDGVYLSGITTNWTTGSIDQTTGNTFHFKGTYTAISGSDWPENSYGVTTDGHVVNAGASSSLKAFHAYFSLDEATGARLSIAIDEGDVTTLIGAVKMMEQTDEVYDLQGRRVGDSQMRKGIYVVNGRKVIVK